MDRKLDRKGFKNVSQSFHVLCWVLVRERRRSTLQSPCVDGHAAPCTFQDDKPLICLTLHCPENATFHIYEYKQRYYLYLSNI